jgi:hypothetical protein
MFKVKDMAAKEGSCKPISHSNSYTITKRGKWKCTICGYTYGSKQSFYEHKVTVCDKRNTTHPYLIKEHNPISKRVMVKCECGSLLTKKEYSPHLLTAKHQRYVDNQICNICENIRN